MLFQFLLYVVCACAHVCITSVCVWEHLLIVTLCHCLFIGVCDVENVNFSHQADVAAIRHYVYVCVKCVCMYVVDHLFTRLLTIFPSYLSDLQLLSTPAPVWKCVW